ncbi:MAG: WYL domain-containing protein [Lachnospiraceae bacterium]|nr:WYL domain-containing protein [Lachnospiraceae bacterium]
MAANDQKLRTLYLMQILLEETDESHILNASELIGRLKVKYNMEADRRTVYGDIDVLERFGLSITQLKGKNPGYYVDSRDFELAELKLLVDAVQSSKFITEKKTRELIRKLETLCSRQEAEQLSREVLLYNRPKTKNETIYYNVDNIHSAMAGNRQITFQYAEWTTKAELRPKKNGAFYVVSPWRLTWDNENYYLIAYDEEAGKIKHYRVDKMQKMQILETERKGEDAFEAVNLTAFAKKTFGMFGGKDREVTLLCRNELAGVVIDRFGQDIWMIPEGPEHFKAKVMVTISPQFFGWVTGIGGKMKIAEPSDVQAEYREYIRGIIGLYE